MARWKIVFVIVEGASDDTALGVALNQVFDTDMVYIHIVHGDITTKAGVTSLNIISKIGDTIRGYARARHYKPGDFKQILHIVDTDGVYIPDTNVIAEESAGEVVYESDGIYTSNADGIIARNKIKWENLYRLRANGVIWGVPYRVYYMSCNLDHVLYDRRNSTDDEKERNAYSFAKRHKGDRAGFVEFICKSDFSVKGDFKESWKHIETGLNSLERYTNLCLCINEVILAQGE